MESSNSPKTKTTSLGKSFLRLVVIFMAQLVLLWLIGKIFPDIACSAYAENWCQPQSTTEAQMLRLFLPVVFIPLALAQFKQVVMYAGALSPAKKLIILFSSVVMLIVMLWQFIVAIGALLGRWFG
ncbi:hypothetical protein IPM44_03040 [bacterium]|nr:MAG: hypothetical protein IPM44_03040 [bacterium]